MNENNMNNLEEFENTEIMEVCNESSSSGKGIIGKVVLGTLIAGAAAAAVVWHKTKDKREAKKIEKLRAKGYIIYSPDEIEESGDVCDVEVESND